MAITYKTAPTVEVGQIPTSTQWNGLVQAYFDHMRYGVGDPTWRIWAKYFAFLRNIRTAVGDETPAVDEWFSHYMHAGPTDAVDFTPENELNPLQAFVLGSASYGIADEARIAAVPTVAFTNAVSAWEEAKAQRGAFDPETGAEAAPALAAARAIDPMIHALMFNGQNAVWPFLGNYGGWMPSPPLNDFNCTGEPVEGEEGLEPGAAIGRSVRFYFTNLNDSSVRTWVSNCKYESGTDVVGENLAVISVTDEAYVIAQWDGTVVKLPFAEWIIGPFEDSTAMLHPWSPAMEEVLQAFASKFGFNFQSFLTHQYALAPAMGTQDGDTVEASYPQFTNEGAEVAADGLVGAELTIEHPSQLVVLGVKVTVEGLAGTLSALGVTRIHLRIEDTDATEPLIGTVTVAADGDQVVFFNGQRSCSVAGVRAVEGIAESTVVTVEWAIVEKRLPRVADAYVVLRLGTTTGDADSLDATGPGGADGATRLLKNRVVSNAASVPAQATMQNNPVYEAARQMLRKRMRLMKRQMLKGYEVVDGKSALFFDRTVEGLDAWEDVAPPMVDGDDVPVESGSIEGNVIYRAGGAVSYNGNDYEEGDVFTGVVDVTEWTGDGPVFQHDGIVSTAPKRGFTNEWLMFCSSNSYTDSGDLDVETYGDTLCMLQNRCLFYSSGLRFTDLCAHASDGVCNPALLVQAPSAHNYFGGVDGLNSLDGASDEDKTKFFRSCQVYPPDYVVESVTWDSETGEVRVQLAGRLRTLEAGDIAREDAAADCAGQDYRTDENMVRQYLRYADGDGDCIPLAGDTADLVGVENGSCQPRFYFTAAPRRVYEDGNNRIQPHDTRMLAEELQWLGGVLDAICGGFLDVRGMAGVEDCPGNPAQYRYANLCAQVAGMQSVGLMTEEVRTDRPQGCGPFAHTKTFATHFNRLAEGVNLLTAAPLDLPWQFEHRTRTWTNSQGGWDWAHDLFTGRGQVWGDATGIDPEGIEGTPSGWSDGPDLGAVSRARASILGPVDDPKIEGYDDGPFVVASDQSSTETRLKEDQLAWEALGPDLADLVAANFAVVGKITVEKRWFENNLDTGAAMPNCGVTADLAWDNDDIRVVDHVEAHTYCATIPFSAGGVISFRDLLHEDGPVPDSFYAAFANSEDATCEPEVLKSVGFVGDHLANAVRVPLV